MKIICVGRNYTEHIHELGNQVPGEPILFMKPETALLPPRNPFFIPDFSSNVHYEIEVVVKISRLGKHIEERFAGKYYDSVTVGVDFTARDLQDELTSKGLPWEKAKAFDGSAVVGRFVPVKSLPEGSWNFLLRKNGEVVQRGSTSQMLRGIDLLISEISKYFTLRIGDLIFTGTPAGVGSVSPEDELEGELEGKSLFRIRAK